MVQIKKEINGIKFLLSADEALTSYLDKFLGVLEKISPDEMKDGYILELGFSIFKFIKKNDAFVVTVPDYLNSPLVNTTEDLTIALWIMFEQIDIINKYNFEGASTRFDDRVVISKSFENSNIISMQRYQNLGYDASGWCIESVQEENGQYTINETKEYNSIYAYQLLSQHSYLLKLLVLPYNYIAIVKDKEILDILDENDNSILE